MAQFPTSMKTMFAWTEKWADRDTYMVEWNERLTIERINELLNKAPTDIDMNWFDPRILAVKCDTAILIADNLPKIDEKKLLIMEFLHLNNIPEEEYEWQIAKLMEMMDINDLRRKVQFLCRELSRVGWEILRVDPLGVI